MARVLIGWELGAGFGHITRLIAIAHAIRARGHQPFLALRNLVETWPAYRSESFPVLQAPMWQPSTSAQRFHASSIADIIAMSGFLDPADLMPMVRAWDRLIDAVRPEVIVADYSPTLCLATYGAHHLVVIGDGFTAPPDHLPSFPVLRPTSPRTASEERIVATIRAVQNARGRPPLDRLPQLFAAHSRFVCTLPELDPYRAHRTTPAEGAFQPLPQPAPRVQKPGFFAYLATDARFIGTAVRGLVQAPVKGRIYIRRATRATKGALQERGHTVYDAPAPILEVLREEPVILHHGGIGTTETALACGRPQILFPRHLEQQLTATAIEQLGVGLAMKANFTEADVVAALQRVLDDPGFSQRAQAFATTIAGRAYGDNIARIADRCAGIAAPRAAPGGTARARSAAP